MKPLSNQLTLFLARPPVFSSAAAAAAVPAHGSVTTAPSVAYLNSTPTLCCRAGMCQICVFPRATHWSPSLVSSLQINPFIVLFQAGEGRLGVVSCLTHNTTIPFNYTSTPGSIQYPSLTPRKFMCYSRSHRYEHPCTSISQLTNRVWALLNLYKDAQKLLLIAGIEINPGPDRQKYMSKLSIAHVNINSITAPGKIDELQQFVDSNNIHVLALSEVKTDNTVHPSLYTLSNFHSPLIKHRTRHGGGTATYANSSLPIMRLPQLEIGDEEWIWCKITLGKSTLIICCVYLPPNLASDRLELFLDRFIESVSMAHMLNPTAILITGDFNSGNSYLTTGYPNSGITAFDQKLKDTTFTLDLHQLIDKPTRVTNTTANLRDLIFTNNDELVTDSGILSPFSTLDHFPVYARLNLHTTHYDRSTYMQDNM